MNRKQHWEKVYGTKPDREVGWFQEKPATSLRLIQKYCAQKDKSILDAGGGNSYLSWLLSRQGYSDLTVLDISGKALERSKERFGSREREVKWVNTNILDFKPEKVYCIWHDRAVFHFLTAGDEINQYAQVASNSIVSGGYLIVATFSTSGPETCSGLPVTRYTREKFCKVFDHAFDLVECFWEVHTTPSGNPQHFIWAVFKRK